MTLCEEVLREDIALLWICSNGWKIRHPGKTIAVYHLEFDLSTHPKQIVWFVKSCWALKRWMKITLLLF